MRALTIFVVTAVAMLVMACGSGAAPTPIPTRSPTPIPTPTPTPVPFNTTSFKVSAGEFYTVRANMESGSRLEYRFSSDLDIDVRVVDPLGNVLSRSSRTYEDSGSVVANSLGTYELVFDNSFSVFAGKDVTLRYRIVPPGGR